VRIALGIEYDGSHFTGWQTQAGGTAVQDFVERALQRFCGAPIATVCAGRTDAGVHACCQVVHFDCALSRPPQSWVRGVNSDLPRAVAVRWAREVPAEFHARYGATGRRYDYWILNDPVRSPLLETRTGWVYRTLDDDAMRAAAAHLVGTHDFSSFRSAECQAGTPVRELRALEIARAGRLLRIRVGANAFLHHMVRNIVGALVAVGVGRYPPSWLAEVLAARDRRLAAPTFAAAGLYLTGVEYDPRFDLPTLVEPEFPLPCPGPASRSAD
jgi:tRNA pseudouridine38-40 synthase